MFLDNCEFVSGLISEIRVGTNDSTFENEFFESFHESQVVWLIIVNYWEKQDAALDRLLHMSFREESQLLMEEDTPEAFHTKRLSDVIEPVLKNVSVAAANKSNRDAVWINYYGRLTLVGFKI